MTSTWREATRDELQTYYTESFPGQIDALPSFITVEGPKEYALAFREPYPVRKQNTPDRTFIRRETWQTSDSGDRIAQHFGSLDELVEFIQYPARHDPFHGSDYALADPDLLERPEPRPKAVYYALDHWERPWVLAVDIDAKDIAAQRATSQTETTAEPTEPVGSDQLRDAGILDSAPEGYPYAFADIEQALEYGFTVKEIFEDDFAATETMVVYSGQGCHVYLLDTDHKHRYDEQSREVINDLLLEEYEIPIDPVVTADRRRVLRLPYSLHADVSRVVQPVESPDFDFQTEAVPQFSRSMSRTTPLNDEYIAYRVAALPRDEGQFQLTQLFERGYQRWMVDDTQETEKLLADIERFTCDAFAPSTRRKAAERPYVDDPGMLAVFTTLGAVCIMDHPKLEETPPRHLALLGDLRELYVNNIGSLIREYDDFTLHQEIAEILYAKEPGEDGPHSGRVCTDITTRPEFGEGYYLEIPLVAASRKCLARTDRDDDQQGEIRANVADNHLYVPVSDFMRKYRSYAEDAFGRLLTAQEEALTPEQRSWLTANESAITERIDRFFAGGQTHRLWENWSRQKQQLRTIINAVQAADNDIARIGQTHTARELYEALEAYDSERSWEQQVCDSISTPRSLGTILSTNRDHPSVTVENDRLNRYTLTRYSDGAQPIHVDDLEDLFELPCLAAMDERLQEKKPVRKDLYNLVRMAWWLPQYQDASTDEFITDMKEVFARWPWYDDDVTEYQIRYELNNDIGGEIPLPMNCLNDDMQRYCIGCDQCPYSIYGSLPFPEELYDQLDNPAGVTTD